MSDSRQKEPVPPFAIEKQEDAQRDGAAPTQIERRRWRAPIGRFHRIQWPLRSTSCGSSGSVN